MGNNTIYIVFGILAIVYFLVFFANKRGRKRRKGRQFMEGKRKNDT